MKYRRDLGLGEVFAGQLARLVRELKWNCDVVIPVPLGKARQAERGFNQVEVWARPLAWAMGSDYKAGTLQRTRETASQVGLSIGERELNVRGAFAARREMVLGKNVLLVDDVMTTGSTLESCAQALMEAGASEVFALTLARAMEAASDF